MSRKLTEDWQIDPEWMVDIQSLNIGNGEKPTHVLVGRRGKFALFCDGNGELRDLRPTRSKWRPTSIPTNATFFQLPDFQVFQGGVYYGKIKFFDCFQQEIASFPLSRTVHPLFMD